jgi:hypothetical protein
MLLSKNFLAFKLLPFLSNVHILAFKPWLWGIIHVLNFEHISWLFPHCRLQWIFFIFPQYYWPMFIELFSLAYVIISKSLSHNQCSFSSFNNIMRIILLVSNQLQIRRKCKIDEIYLNWNLIKDNLIFFPM